MADREAMKVDAGARGKALKSVALLNGHPCVKQRWLHVPLAASRAFSGLRPAVRLG